MKIICAEHLHAHSLGRSTARGIASVTTDVDGILAPKSFEELDMLEKQIRKKLDSNEPIDVEYWEHLLRSLIIWKARAKLRRVSQSVLKSRLQGLRKMQEEEAGMVRSKVSAILGLPTNSEDTHATDWSPSTHQTEAKEGFEYHVASQSVLDPEPALKIRPQDKALEVVDEKVFLQLTVSFSVILSSGR